MGSLSSYGRSAAAGLYVAPVRKDRSLHMEAAPCAKPLPRAACHLNSDLPCPRRAPKSSVPPRSGVLAGEPAVERLGRPGPALPAPALTVTIHACLLM